VKWKLASVHLETVSISVQDSCIVCTEHAKAQKSYWAYLMELVGDVGKVEAHFDLFGDSVNLGAR
jgi:hypothetical protein